MKSLRATFIILKSFILFYTLSAITITLKQRLVLFLTFSWLIVLEPVRIILLYSVKHADRLHIALQKSGLLFVKFGQIIATRADLVGESTAATLGKLHDSMPAFPSHIAMRKIEKELGGKINDLFSEFSQEVVAAASISQVYAARLATGEKVAVKVLRPNIHIAARHEIFALEVIAKLLNCFHKLKRIQLLQVVQHVKEVITHEMDLEQEAANCKRFALYEDSSFKVPVVFWNLTTSSVLVTSWLDGYLPIKSFAKASNESVRKVAAQNLISGFISQVFEHGFFHADLHFGNIFINDLGRIATVDHGCAGTLSLKERKYLAKILEAFMHNDATKIAKLHIDAGYVPQTASVESFSKDMSVLCERISSKKASEINVGKFVGDLFKIAEKHGMQTQVQLLLLQKNLLLLDAAVRFLSKDVNMWDCSAKPLEAWMRQQFGLKSKLMDFAQKLLNAIL